MVTNQFIKMLVDNNPGVLDRVAGIIRRNGWNIESLSVGEVRPGVTEMNFAVNGKAVDIDVLGRHLSGLDFVKGWESCTEETHLFRETVLLKLRERDFNPALFGGGAKVLKKEEGVLFLEYSGTPEQTGELLAALGGGIIECARSGALGIAKKGGR